MNRLKIPNRNYNYKNISSLLAVILILFLALTTACTRSADKKKSLAKAKPLDSVSSQVEEKKKNEIRLTKNYKYNSMDNSKDLSSGNLIQIDSAHPFKGSTDNLDTIYPYLLDSDGNQIVYASSSEIMADKDALTAFNKMAYDFYKEKKVIGLLINSAYTGNVSSYEDENDEESTEDNSNSSDEQNTDESACALVFDLLTYDATNGTYPEFTGEDEYSWVVDNCYKYGFIQSDPENNPGRFRYVGKVNSQIMQSKNLTLGKFNEFIKKYTFEKPFSFTDEDGNNYLLYYVKKEKGESTNVPVALKEDSSEYKYEISGNNIDGYAVCIYVNYTETDSSDTDNSDSAVENDSDNTVNN